MRGRKREFLPLQISLLIFSREILTKIRRGDTTWQAAVRAQAARIIWEINLFGCKAAE
jgi:hypothetical protein